MDTIPVSPPPPSPAIVPLRGTKEGPIPHPSKHLWLLVGLIILILGILVGFLGTKVLSPSSNQSTIAPTSILTPTPTLDPTANWKNYSGEFGNNKYIFRYPNNVTPLMIDYGMVGFFQDKNYLTECEKEFKGLQEKTIQTPCLKTTFSVSVTVYTTQESNISSLSGQLQTDPKKYIDNTGRTWETSMNLGEVYNFSGITQTSERIYIVGIQSGFGFETDGGNAFRSLANQILSTFRFLDTISPTPTSATKPQSTPVQTHGAELKDIRYTLPTGWGATRNASGLHLAPKSGGGYLSLEVFDYPDTTGRREYYCQLHKYCIPETVFTETTIGNISGYQATRLDNSGGGSEYFGAKGNKFYIISTYSPPAPNDFDANYKSVLSSLTF